MINVAHPKNSFLIRHSFKGLLLQDRLYCTKSTFHVPTRPDKKMVFKDLNKVWDQFRSFNAKNTLLVDDSPYKALLNPVSQVFYVNTLEWDVATVFISSLTQFLNVFCNHFSHTQQSSLIHISFGTKLTIQ